MKIPSVSPLSLSYGAHHDCPLPVLRLRKDQGAWAVEHLIVHLFLLPGEAVQEGPVRTRHTSCL